MVPACMATHQLAYDKRMHIQTFQIFFQVFFTPPRKECDGLMGDLIHYHSPVNVPFFSVHSHQDRYRPGPAPLYDGHWHVSGKKIGCRRCFVHAADYRRYGKWSSRICSGCVPPLSGYFARAKKPAGERGAEDFSLTRGISAAELTHIDHERKRMTRYFKPLQK